MKYLAMTLVVCLITDSVVNTIATKQLEERKDKGLHPPDVTYINLPPSPGYSHQSPGYYGQDYRYSPGPTYGRSAGYGGGYGGGYAGGYRTDYGQYPSYSTPPGVHYMSYGRGDKKGQKSFSLKGLTLGAVGGLGLGLGVGAGAGLAKAILLKALLKGKKKKEDHASYIYYPAPNYYYSYPSYPNYKASYRQGPESYDYDYPSYQTSNVYNYHPAPYSPPYNYHQGNYNQKPKAFGFDIGLHGAVPDLLGALKGNKGY